MEVVTQEDFLILLRRSRLLSDGELRRAVGRVSRRGTAEGLAARLVTQEWLTQWQAQQLLAGRTHFFLGKYRLLEKLGQGGMGVVFKARQAMLRRTVALKVLKRELLHNEMAVERFRREFRAAAAVVHPNLVTAYDADQVGSLEFLVMEYVPGRNLKQWLAEHGSLPVDWSCEVVRQAALGLQHAHHRGLVHRDVKPSNLLIIPNGDDEPPTVKLLDLGLARIISEDAHRLTSADQVMGTVDYIAPEQTQDSLNADIRADVYSLGSTLFEMLTGRPPYIGGNVTERLMARLKHDPPTVKSLRPDISSRVSKVVACMLARSPADRYQTPGEAAEALEPFAWRDGDGTTTIALSQIPELPTIKAKPDPSLNMFLDHLSCAAVVEPASADGSPAETTPAPANYLSPLQARLEQMHPLAIGMLTGMVVMTLCWAVYSLALAAW